MFLGCSNDDGMLYERAIELVKVINAQAASSNP